MAENEIALERVEIAARDGRVGEKPEAGVHAIDGVAAGNDVLDRLGALVDARKRLRRNGQGHRRLVDAAQGRQRQMFAQLQRAHGKIPGRSR